MRLNDVFDGTDAEAAGGNQDRERILVELVLPPHGPGIFRFREDGIDGYARDGDPARPARRGPIRWTFVSSRATK